ncbi:IclR family transcriptional regulator [Nonomuraea longispora]|uniref:Glycerol operon regulatory protein n=2 Tax=Nonomuraea longispora TaxID=1848320 RepID=A0A4R4NDU5_9ACTN|nr:IclR family transcriptional regulator [Nonomuraea longispora]
MAGCSPEYAFSFCPCWLFTCGCGGESSRASPSGRGSDRDAANDAAYGTKPARSRRLPRPVPVRRRSPLAKPRCHNHSSLLRGSNMNESVRKAADILSALADVGRDASAREIGVLLDLPKSTVQRLLQALEQSGLVRQDAASRRYGLGPKTLTLGMSYLDRIDVRSQALPHMMRLRDDLDETIALAVRVGHSRVYVEQVESRSGLKAKAEVGRPYPLWAGAAGRVLLASLPREELIRFTLDVGDAAFTHVNPPTLNGLLAQIEETRRRGYAWAFEEAMRGVHTVAAPIPISMSEVAALSVSGPSTWFDESRMKDATGPLMDAARAISSSMGYTNPLPR